jgi:hypothetical protein
MYCIENRETYMAPVIDSPWEEAHTLWKKNVADGTKNIFETKAKWNKQEKVEQYHIQDNHTPNMF